jgi:serine protease AprX
MATDSNRSFRRAALTMAGVLAMATSVLVDHSSAHASARASGEVVEVLVLSEHGMATQAEAAVVATGGRVTRRYEVVDGVQASLPADQVATLDEEPGIVVVPDVAVGVVEPDEADDPAPTVSAPDALGENPSRVVSDALTPDPEATDGPSGGSLPTDAGASWWTARRVAADAMWSTGNTGQGIDVAVVDTGVAASHEALSEAIVGGVDLSGGDDPFHDGHGHGTHLASIIAGSTGELDDPSAFTGIAPDAGIVSVKVAGDDGSTTISTVIAGLDWVLREGDEHGLDIRVVNLAFGAPPLAGYRIDPLAAAVERLWSSGIVVVAAAGNVGPGFGLAAPAYDPYLIAVGALDSHGTVAGDDDDVASFSASGSPTQRRTVDVVAPGRSVHGALAPGSLVALEHPTSIVGGDYVVGTGTSQATAVVAGAAALVLGAAPRLSPDQVKHVLRKTARRLAVERDVQGAGVIDLGGVASMLDELASSSHARQTFAPASANGVAERDGTWDGSRWAGSRWAGSRWAGSRWAGSRWAGQAWVTEAWTGTWE